MRAWLKTLVNFAVKDHVRHRLGWRSIARTTMQLEPTKRATAPASLEAALRDVPGVVAVALDGTAHELVIDHVPGAAAKEQLQRAIEATGWAITAISAARDRRLVGSGADRIDTSIEPSVKPGMTDRLTLEHMLGEIRAHADGFPAEMRAALDLWMADVDYDEIAERVGLPDAQRARALVRAAHARLRDRFRGAWPEWFG